MPVILADPEALLLFSTYHVTSDEIEPALAVECNLPWIHLLKVRNAAQAQSEPPADRLFGHEEDPAGLQNAGDLAKHDVHVLELAECLKSGDKSETAVLEGEPHGVARDEKRILLPAPNRGQALTEAESIGGKIQRNALGAKTVGKEVRGVAHVGTDLKEGSQRADKIEIRAKQRFPSAVFSRIFGQRGGVIKGVRS